MVLWPGQASGLWADGRSGAEKRKSHALDEIVRVLDHIAELQHAGVPRVYERVAKDHMRFSHFVRNSMDFIRI